MLHKLTKYLKGGDKKIFCFTLINEAKLILMRGEKMTIKFWYFCFTLIN